MTFGCTSSRELPTSLVLGSPVAAALTTEPSFASTGIVGGVLRRELVPVGAMGLGDPQLATGPSPSSVVLSHGYRLKVLGADAGRDSTQVIEDVSVRDRANARCPRKVMGFEEFATDLEVAVSLAMSRARPNPTSPQMGGITGDGAISIDLSPEAVLHRAAVAGKNERNVVGIFPLPMLATKPSAVVSPHATAYYARLCRHTYIVRQGESLW